MNVWLWLCAICVLPVALTSSADGLQAATDVPRRSSGAVAYPEVARVARCFVGRSLASQPRIYRIATSRIGATHPSSPFFVENLSPLEILKEATCEAQVVLVARVTQGQSFLDVDDMWMFTEYVLRVERVVSGRVGRLAESTSIRYLHPGGEVLSGRRRIATELSRYPPLVVGDEYMLFLRELDPGLYRAVNLLPFLSRSASGLMQQLSEDYPVSDFSALSEFDATRAVSEAQCRRRE